MGSWSHGSNPMELHGRGGLAKSFCTKMLALSSLELFLEWLGHLADSPGNLGLNSHRLQHDPRCAPHSLLGDHEELCDHTIGSSLFSWNMLELLDPVF